MISEKMAKDATLRMTAMKYFPSEDAPRTEIAWLLMRMVGNQDRLDWLINMLIDRVGEWPGTREVRAIYCTRFKPEDGVEEYSMISGFTASDCEGEHLLKIADDHMEELQEPRDNRTKQICSAAHHLTTLGA